mmetsp:Transcript_3463/g.5073  ORF Transcript_3463/g.5073 Transcript_3463/m.5073 type:complete len:99 (+) Transcript_3463:292-588(+)
MIDTGGPNGALGVASPPPQPWFCCCWIPCRIFHKQKLEILTGISFQLALNLVCNSNGIEVDSPMDPSPHTPNSDSIIFFATPDLTLTCIMHACMYCHA